MLCMMLSSLSIVFYIQVNGEQMEIPQQAKLMSLLCRGCNEIFMIPSRRGRPPAFCSRCGGNQDTVDKVEMAAKVEEAKTTRQLAEERVDRLELMLRANGTHIKQHREKYPWA
jgi:hypothetical protein